MRANRAALWLGLFSLLCGAGNLWAQQNGYPAITKFIDDMDDPTGRFSAAHPVEPRELLLRMGTQIQTTELDCSHFVQWLFEQAGLHYDYAPSRSLYNGMDGFKRVLHPRPGDLVVWRGHVGIVIDPGETTFVSALRSGVKTASYTSHYWKRRGHPRFFRYAGESDDAPSRSQQAARPEHEGHEISGQ
jgi:cell wall-associated NlpC family hydrolase